MEVASQAPGPPHQSENGFASSKNLSSLELGPYHQNRGVAREHILRLILRGIPRSLDPTRFRAHFHLNTDPAIR